MNDNHYQQNLYMKINLTITGCMGRMGQQLIKSSNKNKNFKLVSLTENFRINKKINNILPEFNNVNSFKKTNIIIDAALRKANNLAIPAYIFKKGDPDAGAIFLELETDLDCVHLFHRRFDFYENISFHENAFGVFSPKRKFSIEKLKIFLSAQV